VRGAFIPLHSSIFLELNDTQSSERVVCVQVNYQSATHPLSDGGRNYAYRGIDVDAFLNCSVPLHAKDAAWSSLVDNVRHIVLQFIHTGSVSGWQTFPRASYDVSSIISNATTPRYLSKKCNYWREHGFFPLYAWMN